MKVLAIGAHPDDIEIFMFGLLSIFKERGDEVFCIVATDGAKGGDKNLNLPKLRKEESIQALKGISIPIFLNLPDGKLGYSIAHKEAIEKKIQTLNPDLLITHDVKDYHSDHRNLSIIVNNIISHYVPILYCDTMMGLNFNPNYYVDITKFFKNKIDSLLKHKTQNPERFVNLIKLMNSYRSAQCNSPLGTYAEAYKFEQSFPFATITNLLPPPPDVRTFHINSRNGFL